MAKKSHTEAQTKPSETDLDSTNIDSILAQMRKSEDAQKSPSTQSTDTNQNSSQKSAGADRDFSQSAGKAQMSEQTQTKDTKDSQIQDLTNTLKMVQADFENYKKRAQKESQEFMKFANSGLIKDILPVLDNFELALKNETMNEQTRKGFELIYAQLYGILEDNGLKVIQTENQKFNPNLHEALLTEKNPSKEDGLILEELQKGYFIGERVLRHSKVKVNKK